MKSFRAVFPGNQSVIYLHWFFDEGQGTFTLNLAEAENLCNELGLAIAEYKLAEKEEDAKRDESDKYVPEF